MRFFIVIDGNSSLSPATIKQILWKKFHLQEFEILPRPGDVFNIVRDNPKKLKAKAYEEARRVFDHYEDARGCMVVYSEPKKSSLDGKTIYFEHVVVQYCDNTQTEFVLNERLGLTKKKAWYVSSPTLQPLLTDILVEYALVELVSEH